MMPSRKHIIVFLTIVAASFSVLSEVWSASFVGATTTKKTEPPKPQPLKPQPPKPQPPKPQPPKPQPPTPPRMVTCPKCRQQYYPGQGHFCPVEAGQAIGNAINNAIENANQWITCRNCGQRYRQGQFHRCPPGPVIVEGNNLDRPRVVTCRNCGTRYYEGQRHVCPQSEVVGNPLPPSTPSVAKANPDKLRLTSSRPQSIQAIKKAIVDPLKDAQIDEIKKNMPSDKAVENKIDKFNPALSLQEKKDLMQAIKDGDTDKVKNILNTTNAGLTGEDQATLLGVAKANDIINKANNGDKIKQSEIAGLVDTLKNGDKSLLGSLTTQVQILGKIAKIGKILDFTLAILNGGNVLDITTIPTGVVAIVVFPDLPYGVVFPLGNGVWGMGTGGAGTIGIYQGYIPQPPIYSDNSINVSSGGVNLIIGNETGEDIRYYVHDSMITTLENRRVNEWSIDSNQIRVRLPSGKSNGWITADISPGAYEFARAKNGGWTLKEVKTEVTITSPGNPVPFTFFIGDEKYVIEPGKSIHLNDPDGGNSVYEVRFARSPDKEDVAMYAIGGKAYYVVGKDQSDGKWSLFSEGTQPVKPPAPQQSTSSTSSSLTYDDAPISASNLSDLPVLPSYD